MTKKDGWSSRVTQLGLSAATWTDFLVSSVASADSSMLTLSLPLSPFAHLSTNPPHTSPELLRGEAIPHPRLISRAPPASSSSIGVRDSESIREVSPFPSSVDRSVPPPRSDHPIARCSLESREDSVFTRITFA
ncbi:hypothetical protein NL676_028377 [Syzygium grande]|nr:hypothetical protein NL676_028377 [Syzygium grande]